MVPRRSRDGGPPPAGLATVGAAGLATHARRCPLSRWVLWEPGPPGDPRCPCVALSCFGSLAPQPACESAAGLPASGGAGGDSQASPPTPRARPHTLACAAGYDRARLGGAARRREGLPQVVGQERVSCPSPAGQRAPCPRPPGHVADLPYLLGRSGSSCHPLQWRRFVVSAPRRDHNLRSPRQGRPPLREPAYAGSRSRERSRHTRATEVVSGARSKGVRRAGLS